MRRSIGALLAAAALGMLMPLAAVQASPGVAAAFDVTTTLGSPSGGPFTATGPAVDAGLLCVSGWTTDVSLGINGNGKNGSNFQVLKSFICDDGSGSFLLKLQVRSDRKGDNYSWQVAGGTGAYMRLQGTGSGYGTALEPGVLLDHFAGTLH